jgi:hypothetical protein
LTSAKVEEARKKRTKVATALDRRMAVITYARSRGNVTLDGEREAASGERGGVAWYRVSGEE